MARQRKHNAAPGGELRIIGGDWRSRVLRFPEAGGVRPTPARTRETLFNWLSHSVPGSHCLDLFSGSGALGLEALSRGAESATFVDHTQKLTQALTQNLQLLDCHTAGVVCQSVDRFVGKKAQRAFDVVFMDPPFRQGWLETLLPAIEENGWVARGGWVYVEYESERDAPLAPSNWHLHRQKAAGQVAYCLFRVAAE